MLKGPINREVGASDFYIPSGKIINGLQRLNLPYPDGHLQNLYNGNSELETEFGRYEEWAMPAICYARMWFELLQLTNHQNVSLENVLRTVNMFGNPNEGWKDEDVASTAQVFNFNSERFDLSETGDLERFRQTLQGTTLFLTTIIEVAPDQVYDSDVQIEEHWVLLANWHKGNVIKIDSTERQMHKEGFTTGRSIITEPDILKMMNGFSTGGGKLSPNETRVSPADWTGPVGFLLKPKWG